MSIHLVSVRLFYLRSLEAERFLLIVLFEKLSKLSKTACIAVRFN